MIGYSWRDQLKNSIRTISQLEQILQLTEKEREDIQRVLQKIRMRITPYYASLIDPKDPDDPIRMQVIPALEELDSQPLQPLDLSEEKKASPVPGIRHKYPDRALLLPSYNCATYCRHCFRKFWVETDKHRSGISEVEEEKDLTREDLERALGYLRAHSEIKEVLISGGDPLLLGEERLYNIIQNINKINHIQWLRIGTRIPVTLPQRIYEDESFIKNLPKNKSIYIVTHFNHPRELTEESERACDTIVNNGMPILNQTVLLRGVNDNAETLRELFYGLLRMRVKPYYLFHCISTEGTSHLSTPIETGTSIMRKLQGRVSGLALPSYVIPTYKGKIPMNPVYVLEQVGNRYRFESYKGDIFEFVGPSDCRVG